MATFRKSDWLDDWYVLDNATDFGVPEGTAEEWREIVAAIRERRTSSFKRVAAYYGQSSDGKSYWWNICSPRNANGESDHYPLMQFGADDFCKMVEAELALHDVRESAGSGI